MIDKTKAFVESETKRIYAEYNRQTEAGIGGFGD